jgi:hypothetical protein
MAIQMKLGKENNHIGVDFEEAYWVLENVGSKIEGDSVMFGFNFNAYSNKEACHKTQAFSEVSLLSFGGSIEINFSSKLYTFFGTYQSDYIFPNGIPTTREEQLIALYQLVKTELNLTDYVDV